MYTILARTKFELTQLENKMQAIESILNEASNTETDTVMRMFSLINEMNLAYHKMFRSAYEG